MIAVPLALALALSANAARAEGQRITMEQALALAFERSPTLAAARAAVAEAEGRRTTAGTYPFNPELGVEGAARTQADAHTGVDWSVALDQEVELKGQTGRREKVADAELAGARADLQTARRALSARVHLAFVDALAARELAAIEETHAALARDLVGIAEKRLQAGAGTQLEVNVAHIELGRAEGRVRAAQAEVTAAGVALAEVLAGDPAQPPEADGALDLPDAKVPPLPALLEQARAHRPELEAVRAARQAAGSRVDLADAEAVPNLGVGLFAGREADGPDKIFGAHVSLPLPLFNRNQGARAEARATVGRVDAESAAVGLQVDREVAAAVARLQAATGTVQTLREHVVGTAQENLRLLEQAVEAGKIGGAEVLVVRQELREAQRELVEALADAWRARVELDVATGGIALPPTEKPETPR
jgi:cobalt-zinc-cadmium efflux system outer membrane protein